MSTSSPSLNSKPLPIKVQLSEKIRQKVDNRHWQLFETRLKKPLIEANRENYTRSNDYRIVDCLKKVDQPQSPIEPNQRWQTFCLQLTKKSNETERLMSMFHNVWINNWNTTQQQHKTDTNSNEKTLLNDLSLNEHDKKVVSSILHENI